MERDVAAEPVMDDDELDLEHLHDEDDDAFCGPPTETDCIDEELEALVKLLEKAGYDAEFSENAVYTALSLLVDSGRGEDTPEMDESIAVRQTWVATHSPMIRRALREELRLKFNEE